MSTKKRVILAVSALLLVVLFGLIIREFNFAFTAKPNPVIDYGGKITQRVREVNSSLPGANRKYDDYVAIVQAIADGDKQFAKTLQTGNDAVVIEYSALYSPKLTEVERTVATQALASHVAAGRVAALAQLPKFVGVARDMHTMRPMIEYLLPDLGFARATARLESARFMLAVEAGDRATAVATAEELLAIGSIHLRQATLLDRLVGIAIQSLLFDRIRDAYAAGKIDGARAEELLALLNRYSDKPTMALQLEGERTFGLDFVQWTHSDDGNGDGRLIMTEFAKFGYGPNMFAGNPATPPSSFANFAGLVMPRRKQTERLLNQTYDSMVEQAGVTRLQRKSYGTMDAAIANLDSRQIVLGTIMPAFGKAFSSDDQHTSTLNGVRIMLALEVYKSQTGNYPATLDQLAAKLLPPGVPTDPFAKDGLFRYVPRPAGATAGRPYLLYSVGHDGGDDKANEHPTVDASAYSPNQISAGLDFVFNRQPTTK